MDWLLYTEAVVYEALRLYPTFPVITRESTAAAQVHDAHPSYSRNKASRLRHEELPDNKSSTCAHMTVACTGLLLLCCMEDGHLQALTVTPPRRWVDTVFPRVPPYSSMCGAFIMMQGRGRSRMPSSRSAS